MTVRESFASSLNIIDTSSLVDKVERNLIDIFVEKKLKTGDLIPREVDLALAMGVSRTVIREALNRLRTIGIIETKKKRGTIIKSPDFFEMLQKSLIPNILDENTLRNLFELRLVLEVGMADFIYYRKTAADIEELFKYAENEPETTTNVLFDIDYEIRFHGKLYDITGNVTLKNFQTLLLPIFNYSYNSGLITSQIEHQDYVSHKGLVLILKNGTANDFRTAMRMHLENHFCRVIEELNASKLQAN